ncbi:MAG: hypothetical protein LUC92_04805 [Clostridiales bacterium]|nr:hypothetical protein [Clostridiales bacterium]
MGKYFFNERTEVIYQNPSHPKTYIQGKYEKRWLLLPMCAYKVSVPYPKDSELNIFREAVLKLLAGGAKSDEQLADMLMLNLSLVEFIVNELEERGLITKRRLITREGEQVLKYNGTDYDIKIGWVFFNYVSNCFADAFVADSELNIVSTDRRNRSWIRFYTDESTASPQVETGFIVHTDNEENYIKLTETDVLKICQKHKKRSRRLIHDETDDRENSMSLPPNIEKVCILGEKRYVYTAAYMFLPTEDLINRSRLQLCYPFGTGLSPQITEDVLKASKKAENETLSKVINGLYKQVYALTEKQSEQTKNAYHAFGNKIIKRLSENITRYPFVFDLLKKMNTGIIKFKAK